MVIMLQHCRHALHSVLLVDGGITETFIFQADLIKDSEQSDSKTPHCLQYCVVMSNSIAFFIFLDRKVRNRFSGCHHFALTS